MTMLETRSVSKCYRSGRVPDVWALDGVSLKIARGCFCVLRGSSGSGKTTLLGILGALERPTRGQVLLEDRDLRDLSDVALTRIRRRMGFVFQGFSLIRRLPIGDVVTYPLIPRGVSRAERHARARRILDSLGLGHRITAESESLSAGEQQRVSVARALVSDPEIVLADEPTSNLDPINSREVASLLQRVNEAGTTVIIATHDENLISIATQMIHLDSGTVTACSS